MTSKPIDPEFMRKAWADANAAMRELVQALKELDKRTGYRRDWDRA